MKGNNDYYNISCKDCIRYNSGFCDEIGPCEEFEMDDGLDDNDYWEEGDDGDI